MGFRTNPDRILENIDRARSRESDAPRSGTDLHANVREMDTEVPDVDATNPERMRRIFRLVERTYMKVLVDPQSDQVLGMHMMGADAGERFHVRVAGGESVREWLVEGAAATYPAGQQAVDFPGGGTALIEVAQAGRRGEPGAWAGVEVVIPSV